MRSIRKESVKMLVRIPWILFFRKYEGRKKEKDSIGKKIIWEKDNVTGPRKILSVGATRRIRRRNTIREMMLRIK